MWSSTSILTNQCVSIFSTLLKRIWCEITWPDSTNLLTACKLVSLRFHSSKGSVLGKTEKVTGQTLRYSISHVICSTPDPHFIHIKSGDQCYHQQRAKLFPLSPCADPFYTSLLVLPLSVSPISHGLLTKHQINYPLASGCGCSALGGGGGLCICHALSAESSPASPETWVAAALSKQHYTARHLVN